MHSYFEWWRLLTDSIKPALIMWPAECYYKIKTSVTFYEGHSHSVDCLDMIQSHLIHTWYRNARLLSRPELPYFSFAKMRLPNHTTSSCGIHIIYDMSSVREMVLLGFLISQHIRCCCFHRGYERCTLRNSCVKFYSHTTAHQETQTHSNSSNFLHF